MTRHRAWMLGAGPVVLCLLLAAAGLLLVSAGASMAEFMDAQRAHAVLHGDCPSDPRAAGDVGCSEWWHRETDELGRASGCSTTAVVASSSRQPPC